MKLTRKQILTVFSIILVLIVAINYKSIHGSEILNSKILEKSLEMGQDLLLTIKKKTDHLIMNTTGKLAS